MWLQGYPVRVELPEVAPLRLHKLFLIQMPWEASCWNHFRDVAPRPLSRTPPSINSSDPPRHFFSVSAIGEAVSEMLSAT
jgi:hypothetical protein